MRCSSGSTRLDAGEEGDSIRLGGPAHFGFLVEGGAGGVSS